MVAERQGPTANLHLPSELLIDHDIRLNAYDRVNKITAHRSSRSYEQLKTARLRDESIATTMTENEYLEPTEQSPPREACERSGEQTVQTP